MSVPITILIFLLILSSFFSAAEVAFVTLTDAKISAMVKKKLPRAKSIRKLKLNPRRLLITVLIGNNIVNIGATSLATVIMTQLFDSAAIGITTGIMTLLVLIFGEIIPKSYASTHAPKFAVFATPLIQLLQFITYPIIRIFEWITHVVTGGETVNHISEEEIKALTLQSAKQGNIEKEEHTMIKRLFKFNDITAEDIMTPRVQVNFLSDDISIEKATDIIKDTSHSRFPVMHETQDTIIGFVHARDILLAYHKENENLSIKKITRPILTFPKQMNIDDIMREFQKKQIHLGVVVDEFGGTEGIVTLEDVIEELVGEIIDEHDIDKSLIKRIDKNTIIVMGDTSVYDINDFLNCLIPTEKNVNIAEAILNKYKKLPRKGTEIKLGNTIATIVSVKNRRIEKIQIKK